MKKVTGTDTVVVNYTGKLEDGSIFDSSLNEGREPLKAKLGQGQLIKGFEDGLVGMTIGDKKIVEIESNEAYGDVNTDLIVEIPSEQIPSDAEVGHMLQGMGPQGPVTVKIVEINESTVKIDANHPLAGKKLIFELELLDIE